MSNRSRSIRRKVSRRAQRRTLLVFVEGAKTEEQYLKGWASRHRESAAITISDTRGVPLTLVRAASEAARRDRRISKNRGGPLYDEYWCVFDRDDHPNVDQAVQMARDNGINTALSVPCMEFWFVIHFEDQTAAVDRFAVQSRSRDLLSCEKSLTPAAVNALVERYPAAKDRAIALDAKHRGDGTGPFPNPSSAVWRLVESIKRGRDAT